MTTELTPGPGSPASSGSDPVAPPISPSPGPPVTDSGWRESLSEDIRGEKSFDVFKGKDWNEVGPVMAKSFLDSQKMIGGSVKIPGKDAKPEEINAFFKKLGRPDKAEEYQYAKPNFVSKDVNWDEGMAKGFLDVAHQIGLNNQQVQTLIGWQGSWMDKGAVNAREQVNQTEKMLKKEWGSDYDRKLDLGLRLLKNEMGELDFDGKEAVNFVNETQIGNHPTFIKIMAALAPYFAEHGLIEGRIAGDVSMEDLGVQLKEMATDKNNKWYGPLNDRGHPMHKEAQNEYDKINEKLSRRQIASQR